jgi:iron-sulfur cluster insertion protein
VQGRFEVPGRAFRGATGVLLRTGCLPAPGNRGYTEGYVSSEEQLMITVTSLAADKINELLAEEQKNGAGLRVFVQGGGCSGFQYGLMIEEDGASPDSDRVIESNGVTLFVDPISVRYLKGAEVDFIDNLSGGGFTIRNPNAKTTCGCGSSFSV